MRYRQYSLLSKEHIECLPSIIKLLVPIGLGPTPKNLPVEYTTDMQKRLQQVHSQEVTLTLSRSINTIKKLYQSCHKSYSTFKTTKHTITASPTGLVKLNPVSAEVNPTACTREILYLLDTPQTCHANSQVLKAPWMWCNVSQKDSSCSGWKWTHIQHKVESPGGHEKPYKSPQTAWNRLLEMLRNGIQHDSIRIYWSPRIVDDACQMRDAGQEQGSSKGTSTDIASICIGMKG